MKNKLQNIKPVDLFFVLGMMATISGKPIPKVLFARDVKCKTWDIIKREKSEHFMCVKYKTHPLEMLVFKQQNVLVLSPISEIILRKEGGIRKIIAGRKEQQKQ